MKESIQVSDSLIHMEIKGKERQESVIGIKVMSDEQGEEATIVIARSGGYFCPNWVTIPVSVWAALKDKVDRLLIRHSALRDA